MKAVIIFVIFIGFLGCAHQQFQFDGTQYRIYNQIEGIGNSNEVFAIDLSNRGYSKVPNKLYEFHKLMFLNLAGNQITSVGEEICHLKELRVLILNENKIKELDSCILSLTKLEVISFIGCGMSHLPNNMAKLKKLRKLVLSRNSIPEPEIAAFKAALPSCSVVRSVD